MSRKYAEPLSNRERQARYRRRRKAEKLAAIPEPPADPVAALAEWSATKLIVPPGHPASGQPMELPDFAIDFLRDGWNAHESALCVARKNAKSAICAVLVLAHLAGPLRRSGWRGCVCSISKEKAAELRRQVVEIAEASGLEGITVRKSPYPGSIEGAGGQTFETLSADRGAGHASGFDLVLIDETGLFPERQRELLAGLRSSVSARAGRIVHLSIKGDSPLYREILDNPATVKHVYAAANDCAIDDRGAWFMANPGLGTIKMVSYMEAEAERVANVPADEPSFRAFDLNLPHDPSREMVCSVADLKACFREAPPEPSGPCYLGFDFGEATSGTSAAVCFPETGLLWTWFAFGDNPDLKQRGRHDNADYLSMERRGELRTYPGRVVPVAGFLADVAADLDGFHVAGAAADGYKDSEVKDFVDKAGLHHWNIDFRRVGAGKDGGRDVRAFQRLIQTGKLAMNENLSLSTAISKSTIRRDANGNCGFDVLSAVIIACGLAEPEFDRPRRPMRGGF